MQRLELRQIVILPLCLCNRAFSRLKIAIANKEHGFKFHSNLEKLKLNHLCFANDLVVFTNADLDSIKIVKECTRGI